MPSDQEARNDGAERRQKTGQVKGSIRCAPVPGRTSKYSLRNSLNRWRASKTEVVAQVDSSQRVTMYSTQERMAARHRNESCLDVVELGKMINMTRGEN